MRIRGKGILKLTENRETRQTYRRFTCGGIVTYVQDITESEYI